MSLTEHYSRWWRNEWHISHIQDFRQLAQRYCEDKRWFLKMQIGVAFPSTSRSTVGSRSTVAKSVTSHLVGMKVWRPTPSYTPGRNRTSAHSATIHATEAIPSKRTSRSTPRKNHTTAMNVSIKEQHQAACKRTRRRTLVKSHRDAQCANIRASGLVNWKFIWCRTTQEKDRSNVSSATLPPPNLVIWKPT